MGRSREALARRRRRHKRNRAARDTIRRTLAAHGVADADELAAVVASRLTGEVAFDRWLSDEIAEDLWACIERERALRDAAAYALERLDYLYDHVRQIGLSKLALADLRQHLNEALDG